MLDEEIASLLEEAGYRFVPQSGRYQIISAAAGEEEIEHTSGFVADELGIDLDDLMRWEDEQLAAEGLERGEPAE